MPLVFVEEYPAVLKLQQSKSSGRDRVLKAAFFSSIAILSGRSKIRSSCCANLRLSLDVRDGFGDNCRSVGFNALVKALRLMSPTTIAMYGWSNERSVILNGILEVFLCSGNPFQSLGCVVSVSNNAVLAFTKAGKIENRVQILFGLFLFIFYFLSVFPWSFWGDTLTQLNIGFSFTLQVFSRACRVSRRRAALQYVRIFLVQFDNENSLSSLRLFLRRCLRMRLSLRRVCWNSGRELQSPDAQPLFAGPWTPKAGFHARNHCFLWQLRSTACPTRLNVCKYMKTFA